MRISTWYLNEGTVLYFSERKSKKNIQANVISHCFEKKNEKYQKLESELIPISR